MDNVQENLSNEEATTNNDNELLTSRDLQPLDLSISATTATTNLGISNANDLPSEPSNKLLLDVPSTSAAAAACAAATQTDSDHPTTSSITTTSATLECPICLQTCIHPAQLPCGHIFCFLCVKGVAYKNKRCAMCRREIPVEFLNHPQLVNGIEDIFSTKTTEDGYQWFYEGRNGWWQYDDRTSQDIEDAYKKGEKSCIVLVAGYVYIVDLESMVQQRQNEPARCRRVKRDLATIPKKGVAGLRIEDNIITATDSNFSNQLQRGLPSNHVGNNARNLLASSESLESYMGNLNLGTRLSNGSIESPTEFITTIAAADAAIRIASDIIGSTLAHADEFNRQSRAELPNLHSPTDPNGPLDHNAINVSGELNELHMATTRIGIENIGNRNDQLALTTAAERVASLECGNRELLGAAEDLLGATQRVIATADQITIDLFEQTLDDFHALTLHNLINSQTEDDSDSINVSSVGSQNSSDNNLENEMNDTEEPNNSQSTYQNRQMHF